MKKYLFLLYVLLSTGFARAQSSDAYLFAYSTGAPNEGLHLASSTDGYRWQALNGGKAVLSAALGKGKQVQNPSITAGPDGKFHAVWACGDAENGIGYASSSDLLTWSEPRFIPVMEKEAGALDCRSPSVAWDPEKKTYFITWASAVKDRFPETTQENGNRRLYATRTTDFQTFTPTEMYYNRNFNVTGATMIPDKGRWIMVYKDDTDHPFPEQKNIRVATSDGPNWAWSAPSAKISGEAWAEEPSILKLGDRWVVYFDQEKDHKMAAVASTDLKTWQDVSTQVQFPADVRSGSAFPVRRDVVDKLMSSGK